MNTFYTSEKHIQILIALLKAHNVKKIIASPGTTNITFVASVQQDPFFEIYSSVDERSAAYIACGLAAESGEPVALTCTGATASRNYMPGLTEAFYRHLPILALTASQVYSHTGQYYPQMLDRSVVPNDVVKHSVAIEPIHDENDETNTVNKINVALLELTRNGGGSVHINIAQNYSNDFSVKTLPDVRVIKRITNQDTFPTLPKGQIGIYVGSHEKWTTELVSLVDSFCSKNNAVVFCDHTSNYKGKYKVLDSLFGSQDEYQSPLLKLDLLVYIGYVSGAYSSVKGKQVWRVNTDGELRDVFGNTTYIFQMKEKEFFLHYQEGIPSDDSYLMECKKEYSKIYNKIPELPFSNIWCAKEISAKLPENSILHLGILNSLRSWNFFDIPNSILAYSNVGGFGIDGDISSLIGASLSNPNKLYFGILGDLAFFYDMNVVGNHIVKNNIRIMLINNGRGTEFRNYNHPAGRFGSDADSFMAAAGHFGNKSSALVKHYAEDLGYEYITASNKEEFVTKSEIFLHSSITERPIIFEVFTDSDEESRALKIIRNIERNPEGKAKQIIKGIIGQEAASKLKKMIKG